jgi:hypothetical protein
MALPAVSYDHIKFEGTYNALNDEINYCMMSMRKGKNWKTINILQ